MRNTFRWLPLSVAIAATTVTLGGCKLSDLVDDDERQTVLQGYVADQHGPLTGAKIEIRDADGISFRTYTNADGRFSLKVDWDDVSEDESRGYAITHLHDPVMLRVLHNGEGASPYYYSVLCNVVYDDARDSVNVNNITDHVLRQVSVPDDGFWEDIGEDYCEKDFADVFIETATALETDFNFFNGPASGFGNLLRNFDAGSLDASGKPVQQIKNSVGSLSAYPDTTWKLTYTGTVADETVEGEKDLGSRPETPSDIIDDELWALIEEALTEANVDLDFSHVSLVADGLGESGTRIQANLKGKVRYALLSRDFDLELVLTGE